MKGSHQEIVVKELPVELRIPHNVERSALSHLTIDIINFILYQRQQIPEPVQLLEREYSERSSNGQRTSKQNSVKTRQQTLMRKQIQKFLDNLDKLRNSLYDAFDENDPVEINLVIGATPFSAKEIFCIDLSQFTTEENYTAVSSRIVSLCSRKLCTALLSKDEFFMNSAAVSNIHVFIKARKGVSMSGWQPWPQYKAQRNKIQLIIKPIPLEEVSIEDKENYSIGDKSYSTPKNSAKKSTPKTNSSVRKRLPLRELPNAENVVTPVKGRSSLNKSTGSFVMFCEDEVQTPIKGNVSLPLCELKDFESDPNPVFFSDDAASNYLTEDMSDSCAKPVQSDTSCDASNISGKGLDATSFEKFTAVTYTSENGDCQNVSDTSIGDHVNNDASNINFKGSDVTLFEKNTGAVHMNENGDCQNVSDTEISGCIVNCGTSSTVNPPTLKEIATQKLEELTSTKVALKTGKSRFLNLYGNDIDEINSSFDNLDCVDMELEPCNHSAIICSSDKYKPNELAGDEFNLLTEIRLKEFAEHEPHGLNENFLNELTRPEIKVNRSDEPQLNELGEDDLNKSAGQETHSSTENCVDGLNGIDPNESIEQEPRSLIESCSVELSEIKLKALTVEELHELGRGDLNEFAETDPNDLVENKFYELVQSEVTENELEKSSGTELNKFVASLKSEFVEFTKKAPCEFADDKLNEITENEVTEKDFTYCKNETSKQFQPLSLKCISKLKLEETAKLQDQGKLIKTSLKTKRLTSSEADGCQTLSSEDMNKETPNAENNDSFIGENEEILNLSEKVDSQCVTSCHITQDDPLFVSIDTSASSSDIMSSKVLNQSDCATSTQRDIILSKSAELDSKLENLDIHTEGNSLVDNGAKTGENNSVRTITEQNDFIWFKSAIVIKGFKL